MYFTQHSPYRYEWIPPGIIYYFSPLIHIDYRKVCSTIQAEDALEDANQLVFYTES